MTILVIALFALAAAGGVASVTTREPVAQTMVLSLYGLVLALLFFVLSAPDVALSEIAVGSFALPLMVLLAVAKVRRGE